MYPFRSYSIQGAIMLMNKLMWTPGRATAMRTPGRATARVAPTMTTVRHRALGGAIGPLFAFCAEYSRHLACPGCAGRHLGGHIFLWVTAYDYSHGVMAQPSHLFHILIAVRYAIIAKSRHIQHKKEEW